MNKGPNQPQNPGHRRRRRRRGSQGKKQSAPGGQPQNNGGSSQAQQHGGVRRNRNRRTGGPAFVGPMDHSYRTGQANGNVSDNGNRMHSGGGGMQANRFPVPDMTPLTTRADAPARIFCFVDDLFFLAKIQEIAKKINVKVEFVKTIDPVLERAHEDVPEDERPTLVVFDLNNLALKPLTLIPKLRAKLKKGTSIIGFISHLQSDLKVKAQEAGFDMVMPRSAFSQNLPQLLRRHGSPEEDLVDAPQP